MILLTFIQRCSAWLLASHYISTYSTVLSVSLHRSHQKTVIKDHNWEWAESGPLWGKLIYLYSVYASTLTVFSSHSHFTQTLSFSLFSSLTNTLVFLTPLSDFKFTSSSLGEIARRTVPHVLKDAKEKRKRKKLFPVSSFSSDLQSAPSHSSNAARRAVGSSQGTVSQSNCTYNL